MEKTESKNHEVENISQTDESIENEQLKYSKVSPKKIKTSPPDGKKFLDRGIAHILHQP